MKNKFKPITSVSYKLLNKNGIAIKSFGQAPCFIDITAYPVPQGATTFVYIVKEEHTPFSLEEIEKYFKLLFKLGFPASVSYDEDKQEFLCTLLLSDYEDNRLKFNSALTMLRYIGEMPFQRIVYEFLKSYRYRKVERIFNALEVAHKYPPETFDEIPFKNVGIGAYETFKTLSRTGHALKSSYNEAKGYENVMKEMNDCKTSIYSKTRVFINSAWNTIQNNNEK